MIDKSLITGKDNETIEEILKNRRPDKNVHYCVGVDGDKVLWMTTTGKETHVESFDWDTACFLACSLLLSAYQIETKKNIQKYLADLAIRRNELLDVIKDFGNYMHKFKR